MLILGHSRGPRLSKEQQWYRLSVVSGGATILLTLSSAFAYEKSKSQTKSVVYMTNFVRCHIETQFQLHKYSRVHLQMQSSVH